MTLTCRDLRRLRLLPLLLPILFGFSCSDNDDGPGDTMPPMAVTDLSVIAMNDTSVTLAWTAPGDDCQEGAASRYDVRYSLVPSTATDWWDGATAVDSVAGPLAPWEPESLFVGPLAADTVYYFALKTADDVPNWSGLSNVVAVGVQDTVPPAAVENLEVDAVTESSVTLAWTAPGDDGTQGTAAEYEIRYGTDSITTANWDSAAIVTPVSDAPPPSAPGGTDGITVGGLGSGTRYYFALQTADEKGNRSGLSNVTTGVTHGLSDLGRATMTLLVTEYLPQAYSRMDSASYAAALDEGYLFELLPSDVDPGDPNPWWDLEEELGIAGNMFNARYNDDGQRVDRIALEMTERSIAVDNTNYPDKPPGETWYKVMALIDLLVVVEDPNDPAGIMNFVVASDQIFTVRPDPADESLWVVYKQVDQEPINFGKTAAGRGTEETSWGSVKSLFR
ncbi:MAG: fibronectin type III domain-containing protein [Candidatus Eisenbacteria bacterium]